MRTVRRFSFSFSADETRQSGGVLDHTDNFGSYLDLL